MKKKNYTTKDFENLVVKIADRNVGNITEAEAVKITQAVAENKKPMFWPIAVFLGLKEGSSYAHGASKLKKLQGW